MPAIEAQRRGGMSLRFRPLGKQIRVTIPTDQEEDVRRIKLQVERACTTGDFSTLDNVSRDIARSAFEKSGFSVPDGLAPDRFRPVQAPPGDLLLWDAVQLFLNYPTIKDDEQNRERHIYAFAHIVTFWARKSL